MIDRRNLIGGAIAGAGLSALPVRAAGDPLAPYRTPYKHPKLILGGSGVKGSFDEKAVDCPFVFSANGKFYLTYVGFDGSGYQTGICESHDLVNWKRLGMIMLNDALISLVDSGEVSPAEAYQKASDKAGMVVMLKQRQHDTSFLDAESGVGSPHSRADSAMKGAKVGAR